MATLVHDCPHCGAARMTFEVLANAPSKGEPPMTVRSFVFSLCRDCGLPITAMVWDGKSGSYLGPDIRSWGQTLGALGWEVREIWPKMPTPSAPPHVPDKVAKAFLAAEQVVRNRGMEEMAAGSYGRALDVGTKVFAPDLAGETLYNRIRKLADQHRISKDLADWAHEIRLIRNDALHEPDGVDTDDLAAIRGFTETVLTYLFTLPGMLAARQAQTKQKPKKP